MENKTIVFDDLLSKVSTYTKDKKDLEIIKKAYEFGNAKYFGEKRLDGNGLIDHHLNVAMILTELKSDYQTISSALLHEVLDYNTTIDEVKSVFGEEISNLVSSISKINKLSFNADSNYTITYYKKILVGLCEDVRVIYIKLADRLHNMRTLWAIPENKQKEKAKETLEILAPIAHRLGIYHIKSELEDLSLRYYKPDAYYDIVKKLNNTKVERDNAIKEMKENISNILLQNNIKHEIKGRSKSIYSIYNKMQKGRRFKEIYDILALRVYVETEQNCYLALGLIHSKFKPVPKRFKDYIAMPKENMYQSLHTTIFGVDGNLFEIQIRTYEMDQIAEYGIASHWSYKEHTDGSKSLQNVMEQKLQMFRSLIELNNEDNNPEEFASNVKSEVLDDNIYLFTPKGDVIELPVGSTPIDFAYRVHTGVGDKMVGAIVNEMIVPLDYELKDGDIVKINVNKNSKGPNREWLNIAKTAQAKTKIKNFFSKIDKDEAIKRGEEMLQKELRKQKLTFSTFLTDKNIDYLLDTLNLASIEDIYRSIGSSKFTPLYVINLINKEPKTKETIVLEKLSSPNVKPTVSKNDVLVEGVDEIKVTLASCCKPIKGDDIIGYITKGHGITVHRSICHNIADVEERIVNVEWNENIDKGWPTNILIEAEQKENLLLEIIGKTTNLNINIQAINTINHLDHIVYDIIVLAPDKTKLDKFINDVLSIPYIHKVERITK
ncbi:MAG TPA: bifunctional (p)ppGpp synthetase/guanosine-3',5'-bis(diphosphate) 3'-pyrophosphohydrolase [Mollicutes bacterium]|nr:bifunctional (p)ppGpp synthetase/guanosine-3',5'-bis(diphosphate) 3'-pyrophosphohydrolase [Mollicutes bacterium]